MWLVGLRVFGIAGHHPAGAAGKDTNEFNPLDASHRAKRAMLCDV
jgi:hypothetical protein